MNVADRTLPHNLDAERAILGAILLHSEAYDQAVAVVHAGDFFRDAHRRIFQKMSTLVQLGIAVDFITLKEELARTGELDEIGGPSYLASLSDGIPRSSSVGQYASIVREKAKLRSIIFGCNKTVGEAYDAERLASEIANECVGDLTALATRREREAIRLDLATDAYVASIEAGTVRPRIASGFTDLDGIIEGFPVGEVTLIAARPSVGKTSLGLGIASRIARAGIPAAFFSVGDMSIDALVAREIAWRSGVPSATLRRKLASDEQWRSIGTAIADMADVPLTLQASSRTPSEVIGWCRRLRDEAGIRCAIIDYMQKLTPEKPGRGRNEEVAATSEAIQRAADELGIAMIAMAQVARASAERRDKRPKLSDLRESGALEQDASCVIIVYREEMDKPKPENNGIAELIVAKNRDGATGICRCAFVKSLARFDDLSYQEAYDGQNETEVSI